MLTVLDGNSLVPSIVRDDGFSLGPATGAAEKYLADQADFVLDTAFTGDDWTKSTPIGAKLSDETNADLGSINLFDAELLTQQWPASVTPLIHPLVNQNMQLAVALQNWWYDLFPGGGPTVKTFERDELKSAAMEAPLQGQLDCPLQALSWLRRAIWRLRTIARHPIMGIA